MPSILRHSAPPGRFLLHLFLTVAALAGPARAWQEPPPDAGKTYRVPYRLSETNHFIVRVKLNGKGPFNLVVDTGAPALYLSTEAARKAGIDSKGEPFLARVESLEVEGGARLQSVQARVEDVFQLVGMNALGLPGVRIDGMIGFNVLARYRITIDPTSDRMDWTRLAYDPPDLVIPADAPRASARQEVQGLNLLGGVAKIAALFVGKQPEDVLVPRGFAGLEIDPSGQTVVVGRVLPGSPAEQAGLKPGDRLVEVLGRPVSSLDDVLAAISKVEKGDKVSLRIRPADAPADSEPLERTLFAAEGL